MSYQRFKKELLKYLNHQTTVNYTSIAIQNCETIYSNESWQNYTIEFHYEESDTVNFLPVKDWIIKECYRRFNTEGWQGILPYLSAHWECSLNETQKEKTAYAHYQDSFILKPYFYDNCNLCLKNYIYWTSNVLTLVLHRLIWDQEGELFTVPVPKEALEHYNISVLYLFYLALQNTQKKMPPILSSEPENRRWYLTTTYGLYGAVALFYPHIQEYLADVLGGDYYVDLYDMHNLLLCPVNVCKNLASCASSGSSKQFFIGQPGYGKLFRYFQDRGKLVEV